MFPAARIADPITHDMLAPAGVIAPVPGAPINVFIEFMPAAKVGDIAVCSGMTSAGPVHPPVPAPPFGTPIVKGSATVLINFLPAARWAPSGDLAACGVFLGMPPLVPTRKTFIGG